MPSTEWGMGNKKKIKSAVKRHTVICSERDKVVMQGQNVRGRDRYMQVEDHEEASILYWGSNKYLCYRSILLNN